MGSAGHYPDYDVMREAEAWDPHTRGIVEGRLGPFPPPSFLTDEESRLAGEAAAVLMDDMRPELAAYVVHELDRRLRSNIGEEQRKPDCPPESVLLRRGLAALAAGSRQEYGHDFSDLTLAQRQALLGRLERGELPGGGPWQGLPQQEFFQKLLGLAVRAYYSHPAVWSEIGYGGPAYPRGYVRSELGLTDPWEAKQRSGGEEE